MPVLLNCNFPPVLTAILPERLFPEAIETGVMLPTTKLLIVESFSISIPELSAEVITFATLTAESFNLPPSPRLRSLVFCS